MTKVLTWIKEQQYWWEREDLKRANHVAGWAGMALMIIMVIVMVSSNYLGASEAVIKVVGVSASMMLGLVIGAVFAFRWADEQIKKSK